MLVLVLMLMSLLGLIVMPVPVLGVVVVVDSMRTAVDAGPEPGVEDMSGIYLDTAAAAAASAAGLDSVVVLAAIRMQDAVELHCLSCEHSYVVVLVADPDMDSSSHQK